jgi:hypothetical protein
MNTILYAKRYAKLGFESFPLKPKEKTPFVKWADVATKDETMLSGWFDNYPDANIGIACGTRSGIVVLDIDKEHGGYESLQELTEKYGALPKTPVSITGSGGEHIFFKAPKIDLRNSAGKLGKGLDIRASGGYVVVPPSIHPNGNEYVWSISPSEIELADMPEWMIDLLKENEIKKESVKESVIVEGGRNDYLTKMAGAMRRKDFSEDAIFAAIQIDNREKCSPPLPDGEVYKIAKSVMRYEAQDVPLVEKPTDTPFTVIQILENDIKEREKNPKDVWGIHYAWDYLSLVTGGKQEGELIYLGGEPKVGKSWFIHQDALFTAIGNPSKNIPETPVFIWSGEMRKKQVYRRFFEMLGVPKRAMQTGKMKEIDRATGEIIDHWKAFEEAKAIVMNSPIYVNDSPLDLPNARGLLEREIGEHGIKQAIFDYDWLIHAYGHNEIETSQNISREMKRLADLGLSITLISSVNKMGMDKTSDNVTKSNLSGSGKKIHDADIVYILTKFNENKNTDLSISPRDYQRIATLHIEAGRDLDYHVPNGAINYIRETPNPKFRELKNQNDKPSWMN